MYIIKNALQNLIRNRGRNLMIGAIIFVIIVSVVTALMINNTANGVINDYKTRFGSEVTLSPNQQKLRDEAMKNSTNGLVRMTMPQLAPEDLIKYGQSDYLQKAVYSVSANGNSDDLTAVNQDKGPGGGRRTSFSGPSGAVPSAPAASDDQSHQYYYRLSNAYEEFENGTRSLDESYNTTDFQARFPQNDNECMISSDLLESSGLQLGDTITVTSELMEMGSEPGDETYTDIRWELTIVGVFSDITQTEDAINQLQTAYDDRRNEILTTLDTVVAKMEDGKSGIRVSATYFLKDPEYLEAYTAELHSKGLSDVWNVSTDSAGYDKVVKPVEALKGISLTFVIIVLIFGAIILALLTSIAIRERKYEIGVLRAMGMKKLKVAAGLWTETLAITLICLILGLSVGALVAQPVTNILYEQQLAAADQTDNSGFPGGSGAGPGAGLVTSGSFTLSGQSEAQPLENLDISLDWQTVLEIVAIAILLSSLSGMIATQKITKYEPIKILMERN